LFVFDLFILCGSEELQVQFVPDDAFYYLQLAKNYVKLGYWTFDSGLSLASGFHPLLAYLLALLYKMFEPNSRNFVIIDITLSSLLTLGLAGWVWVKSIKQQSLLFLIIFTLCVGTQSFLINSVSGVEWPFVIVLLSSYCYIFHKGGGSPKTSAVLFAVGCLLSLARSDTGLFPFALFLSSLILVLSKKGTDTTALTNSLSGFAGAITGLGLVFLHNYLYTGTLIQSSARMKYYWSQFGGSSVGMALTLPLRAIGFDIYFTSLNEFVHGLPYLYLYILLFLVILWMRRRHIVKILPIDDQHHRDAVLFITSLLCLIGYIVVYRYDGVIQNWYTGNYILTMFILSAGTLRYLQNPRQARIGPTTIVASCIVSITFVLNILSTYPVNAHAPWPHQQVMLEAGKYLNRSSLSGRVGAWNAGILGYYQGGTVVNIDGLVNNDIYPYAVNNRLPSYLEEKDVRYVIDFQMMFSPGFRQRGGYDDPFFLEKLKPVITFDQGEFPPWQFLTIYQIKR
jgi:hypothetical protein